MVRIKGIFKKMKSKQHFVVEIENANGLAKCKKLKETWASMALLCSIFTYMGFGIFNLSGNY